MRRFCLGAALTIVCSLVGCSFGPTVADVERSAKNSEDSLRASCQLWDQSVKAGVPSDAAITAAQCWSNLKQEQEIHAQQRAELRAMATRTMDEPPPPQPSTYSPPHSVYTLHTQPPEAPAPSSLPNLGPSITSEPPVKTWGETPCAYLVPPYMHDQPISTVNSAVPSGCR
jgi:hypothetical protein